MRPRPRSAARAPVSVPSAEAAAKPSVAVAPAPAQRVSAATPLARESAPLELPLPGRLEPSASREREALTVVGRVVDLDGHPIVGAELYALGLRGWSEPRFVARSEADGMLRGDVHEAEDRARFTVLAEGYQGAVRQVLDTGRGTLQLGTFRLAPGTDVAGFVVDESGRPVGGALVSWAPAAAFPADPLAARRSGPEYEPELDGEDAPSALSSDDGRFLLRGLPLGECFLVGWKEGLGHGWTEVFEARAGDALQRRIVLPPSPSEAARIDGIVRDPAGAPLANILVRAQGRERRRTRLATTGADGRFLLEGDWSEPVTLLARDPTERFDPTEIENVAPGTRDVELVLAERATVIVRLQDEQGAPVPWGHVRAEQRMHDAGREGAARVPKPAESFQLHASAPGFRTQTFGPFDPGSLGEELVLTLVPGEALRGRVVAGGRPVAGARLGLSRTQPPGVVREAYGIAPLDHPFLLTGWVDTVGPHDGTSDAAGEFVLTLHDDGWQSVSVEADGYPFQVFGPFELARATGWSGLELVLEHAGALEGRVLLPPGAAAVERVVGACNGWSFVRTAPVSSDGSYRIEDLAPGSYQVRPCLPPVAARQALTARAETDEPLRWDCHVTAGETTRHDLDLSQEGSVVLAGELVLRGAEPCSWEARLARAGSATGALRAFAELDPEGRFELRLSRAGPYRLTLHGESEQLGFLRISQDLELVSGRNEWSLRREIGRLRVRASGPIADDWRAQLRVAARDGDVLFATMIRARDLDPARRGDWLTIAPAGPAQLESSADERAEDARWTLVRELTLRAGEELLVEYP